MFREIQLPNGSSKVHLLRISPLTNHCNANSEQDENSLYNEGSCSDKMENSLNSKGTLDENVSQSSSSNGCDSLERSESAEFNLVLPNSNEITLKNEEIRSANIVVLNSSSGSNTSENDLTDREQKASKPLQVEKVHFEQKPVKFKNKVKRFFEMNGSGTKSSSKTDMLNFSDKDGDLSRASEWEVAVCNNHSKQELKSEQSSRSCGDNEFQQPECTHVRQQIHTVEEEVKKEVGVASQYT